MRYLKIMNSTYQYFLNFTIIACFLLSSGKILAKPLEALKLDEMKYLVDLGLSTTRGREYDFSVALEFAKSWPEIVSHCKEKLVKTPELNIKFYLVIRPDGSAAFGIADDHENLKSAGTSDDDSIGCLAEYVFGVKYPSHTFSYFFWTFRYAPDLLEHLEKRTLNVSSNLDQVWKSSKTSAVIAFFSDGRIYLCYGGGRASGAGRTMTTLGYVGDKALITWGSSYMMHEGELINVNEELPHRSIKFTSFSNSGEGLMLNGSDENLLFDERLKEIPATCDRPI